jgi:hypothetical protein
MKYNRRTTRPDGMHYRETRKHVGSSRPGGRRRRGGMHPVVFVVAAIIVAVVVFMVFRR